MNPTPSPIPVEIVGVLPDWLTGVLVPIVAAALAAGIVVLGFAIDARRRDRDRRAKFVNELTQLLIFCESNAGDVMGSSMPSNAYRVRAAAQMKRRELRVYNYASRLADGVLNGLENGSMETALAITYLLEWLHGDKKAKEFPDPPGADGSPSTATPPPPTPAPL